MLFSDELIYIELHKTGCTHTRNLLAKLPVNNLKIIGKHNRLIEFYDKRRDFDKKIIVGNVRNPWDWYVSLWAFGCEHKGRLHFELTKGYSKGSRAIISRTIDKYLLNKKIRLNPATWQKLYSDVNNFNYFRTWLRLLLEDQNHSIGEGYKESGMAGLIGLLTYRYLNLYTFGCDKYKAGNYDELVQLNEKYNVVNLYIKNEDINEGLRVISQLLDIGNKFVDEMISNYNERTNQSKRIRDYRFYFDDNSKRLVANKDRLIIESFGYQF
jgi:hypothetical protein